VSLLVAAPDLLMSAAADLESIDSSLTAAHVAAAVPTTGVAAAAADEVSDAVAALFAGYGQAYQALSTRARAFQQQFLQALNSAAGSYVAAEETGALLLQPVQQSLLGAVNPPTEALIGRPLIGTGSAAGTGVLDTAINDVNLLIQRELGIYNFRDWRGWAAFVLDYTWGFPGTALGYGVQIINAFYPNSNYDPALSALVGSHVYRGGIGLPGFVTTMGNVTTNLGTGPGADDIMINHEEVHVWQSRIFGPLFQTSYVGWMAGGLFVGTGYWLFHPNQDWFSLVETAAYYDNPWEVWAYANDNNWPPPGANPALLWPAWTDPVVLWPARAQLLAALL
jgi:PE family